jgi:predicted RND superfamily exporter protein
MDRFIRFLITARWPLLIVAVFLAAMAYWPSRQVRFDRSIEHMFAKGDPLLDPYQRLKRDFGGNEIVLAVYRDEQLMNPDGSGIKRLAEISQQIKAVPGVQDVLSLSQISRLLDELEKLTIPKRLGDLFRAKDTADPPAILNPNNRLAAPFRELFVGYTHSADGHTAAVVCMLQPAAAGAPPAIPRETTIAGLETIVRNLPEGLPPGVLAGEPVMIEQGFSLLEKDGQRLATWTLLLLGVTILLFFHSLRWLIVPVAVVQWSLIVTQALLAAGGFELSMVSSMLAAIVTVVGVATVMHLIVHVRELRVAGHSHVAALVAATAMLAGPILGAILTDVAGFGSLIFASVEPVRDFGWMMVVGSLLVIPAICLLVPALALVAARDQPVPKPGWAEVQIGYWLTRSIDALHSRPKTVAALALLIALVASVGVLKLEVETDFTRNFRRGSRVVEAYEFVESRLGGAGVWDIIVPSPRTLDRDYIDRVRDLETRLRAIQAPSVGGEAIPALTKVISLVDALDAVAAEPALAALTPTPELRYHALAAVMPTFMAALRAPPPDGSDQGRLRIMLRARERQPAEQKQRLIAEVTRLATEAFPDPDPEVTGFFVLLTNLIKSIQRDQWTTLAIASAAIMAMVWIGFRSWKYALVAMIPNIVPIYMVMGLLGWLGLRLNMGAAMIAAVSMGMSVDSSIHYYAAFRRARAGGKTVRQALAHCQQSVGLAMIFSTVALIVGFGVLVTSEFVPTIYFGALMSLAMLGGMFGNLIVLPLLLSWTERG